MYFANKITIVLLQCYSSFMLRLLSFYILSNKLFNCEYLSILHKKKNIYLSDINRIIWILVVSLKYYKNYTRIKIMLWFYITARIKISKI